MKGLTDAEKVRLFDFALTNPLGDAGPANEREFVASLSDEQLRNLCTVALDFVASGRARVAFAELLRRTEHEGPSIHDACGVRWDNHPAVTADDPLYTTLGAGYVRCCTGQPTRKPQ